MMKESHHRFEGRLDTGSPSPWDMRFDDPDALTEVVGAIAPGIRSEATRPSGFHSRVRAWSLDETALFVYTSEKGLSVFSEIRPYGTVTIPLCSGFGVRVGRRRSDVQTGAIQVLQPGVQGEIEPRDGALLLGMAVDWTRFAYHRRAVTGESNAEEFSLAAPLSTNSESGRRCLSYLDRVCRGLNRRGSLLHDPLAAREVVDTIGWMLADVASADLGSGEELPGEARTRRAEEFLAGDLGSPVSLSDAAIVVGASTRSLLRAFRKRRGTSPMAFRRRRRFDAARCDLFQADPGETTVTMIAGRYCFDHLGRFAVDYRTLFGESPSDTLHGGRSKLPAPSPC
jgi:AraC-like DNA-binding protein